MKTKDSGKKTITLEKDLPPPKPIDPDLNEWSCPSFSNRKEKPAPGLPRGLKWYRLALADHNGVPQCECEDHQNRRGPHNNLQLAKHRGGTPWEELDIQECKHVEQCRNAKLVIEAFKKEMGI